MRLFDFHFLSYASCHIRIYSCLPTHQGEQPHTGRYGHTARDKAAGPATGVWISSGDAKQTEANLDKSAVSSMICSGGSIL